MTNLMETAVAQRRLKPTIIVVLLLLVAPLIGFTITLLQGPKIESEAYDNLRAVARLKSQQIENWLAERQADGTLLAHDKGFSSLASDLLQHNHETRRHNRILDIFRTLRTTYGYDSILMLDINHHILVSQGTHVGISADLRRIIQQAMGDNQILRSNLYRDDEGHSHLDWVVPIMGADGQMPVAVVLLRAIPAQFLYPLIQTWPTASASAETLLVRREGAFIQYMNDLRHRKGSALNLKLPLATPDLPSAIAVRHGNSGITTGKDHRGVAVLAAYQPVVGTDWEIVAKVDRDEVLAPLRNLVAWVSLIALISIGILSLALRKIWRQQQHVQSLLLAAQKEKSAQALSLADASLRENQALTQSLIDSSLDAVISMDQEGRIICWNAQAEHMFGYSFDQAKGREVAELIIPHRYHEAHRKGIARFIRTGSSEIIGKRIEVSGLHATGREFPMELTISSLVQNNHHFFSAYTRDITARKETERSLQIAATAFESQEGIMVTDAHSIILKVNDSFTRITGYDADEVIGKQPAILRSGMHDAVFYQKMRTSLDRDKYWYGEIWNRHKSGEIFPELLRITAVTDKDGKVANYVASFSDISEKKRTEETINTLAFYDPLTHLPNRRLMLDRLQQMLSSSHRNHQYGAVLSIDLDNFKLLNDTKGHDIGDLVLIEVSKRLHTCTHGEDTVSRIGGDEFVVLLSGLNADNGPAATQAETVAERIRAALNQPFELHDHAYQNSSSIGICLFNNQDLPAEELFKRADSALHQAKRMGRNVIRFFDPAMQAALESRVQMESWLRTAIPDQLRIYYQPQVDHHGSINGAEALIRWQHPEKGLISPVMFIPLAEETGLILPIGDWVLETACNQIKAWQTQPALQHLQIAVNISARQFHQQDFVSRILKILERTGANPNQLKLELTESLLVDNVEAVITKMADLKTRGVSFALDDFGTGFSSLSYLKRLPLDQLKIDQSFVRHILTDQNDEAIVCTVIALSQSMGLSVIAEGVETEAQRDLLMVRGCRFYQGYLFGKPLPLEEFERLLD